MVKCEICGGSGSVTGWHLVTYRGNSFTIQKSELIRDVLDPIAADLFMVGLAAHMAANPDAPRQTVLSAAKRCSCIPAKAA